MNITQITPEKIHSNNWNVNKFNDFDEMSLKASLIIFEKIKSSLLHKNKFVLGLASGTSPKGIYKNLVKLLVEPSMDLSGLYTFNLDEYYPMPKNDPRNFYTEMLNSFWRPLNQANPSFNLNNAHVPDGETSFPEKECEIYEQKTRNLGGIDLQILGLGVNGHIGFNEPGSERKSRTRKVNLSQETINIHSKKFEENLDKTPKYALTMGIATILEAKEIILIVHGENKKNIFQKLLNITQPTPQIPASYLMEYSSLTIYSDIH